MKISLGKVLRWLPALSWMAIIFAFSQQPGGESGNLSKVVLAWIAEFGLDLQIIFGDQAFLFIRKLAHFTEYFILYTLLLLAWGDFYQNRWRILGITIIYAATDEFHQLFIPGRVGDIFDVGVDSLGGLFALGFWAMMNWIMTIGKKK